MPKSINTLKSEGLLTLREAKIAGYDFWKRQKAIDQGHFDNLVYDDGKLRVWASRMTLADFDGDRSAWMAERVTFEKRINGDWVKG